MTPPPIAGACMWCGRGFTPRRDGGKEQRFCSPTCRYALDAAGRRWIASALAVGTLTLDELRNGAAATRALLLGGFSLCVDREDEK
jgi:hypothetical protein